MGVGLNWMRVVKGTSSEESKKGEVTTIVCVVSCEKYHGHS